jgi:hypothetical protein
MDTGASGGIEIAIHHLERGGLDARAERHSPRVEPKVI